MEFEEMMNQWMNQVKAAAELSIADQTKITKAGAKVFQHKLETETRSKHYHDREKGKLEHLTDSVQIKAADVDGKKTGVSTVGFDATHAHIARFLNDGTKFIPADHFIDNLQRDSLPEVLAAEEAAYRKIMQEKGGS